MTNFEKVKNMSIEEMANKVILSCSSSLKECNNCLFSLDTEKRTSCITNSTDINEIINWLNQEATDA